MGKEREQALRALPAVDRVLEQVQAAAGAPWPHQLAVDAVRAVLGEARQGIAAGNKPPALEDLVRQAVARLDLWTQPSLRPAINAGGVIVHTNLGRAPLSQAAIAAVQAVAAGYSNLEFDLGAGRRGSRYEHARRLLCRLTGAEAALVVNNNASALLLALSTLAQGHEVIVSRGQAVEIGGGFRIPAVMAQSGARLVEVGTTNRTYRRDYEAAITPESAVLLRVHRSNFAMVGFVHDASLEDLVALGREHGLYVLDDIGSGALLDTAAFGLAHEPMAQESIQAGADVVCFSGDKLLGGPQAGIAVGRAEPIGRMEQHPLARAVRPDKLALAALEATLLHYLREEAVEEVPVWWMISRPLAQVRRRAQRWRRWLARQGVESRLVRSETAVGGGSLPGQTLPTIALQIVGLASVEQAAHLLRTADPPVIARIEGEHLLLDPRTVLPEQEQALLEALAGLRALVGSSGGDTPPAD